MEAVGFLQFGFLLGLILAIGFLLIVCISGRHGLRTTRDAAQTEGLRLPRARGFARNMPTRQLAKNWMNG